MNNVAKIAIGVALGLVLFGLVVLLLSRPASGWTHNVITDPMTDDITANGHLTAADGRGALEISCTNGGELRIIFQATTRMGGYREEENYVDRMLRYRFDGGTVADTVATIGDNYIGFREEKAWDKPIIEGLPSARRLAIDANNVEGEKVQLVFDVSGAYRAMKRISRECRR